MSKQFLNTKGFSIAQMLVVAGLLAGLSVTVVKTLKQTNQAQKDLTQRMESNQTSYIATMALTNPHTCAATLGGLDPSGSGTHITEIKNADGSIILGVSEVIDYRSSAVLVDMKVYIRHNAQEDKDYQELALYFEKADVHSRALKERKNGNITLKTTQRVGLEWRLDADGKIETCTASALAFNEAMCNSVGGIFNSSNLRCTNIAIPDATAGTEPAITAQGNLKVDISLGVGKDPSNTAGRIDALGKITSYKGFLTLDDGDENTDANIIALKGNITAKNGDIISGSSITTIDGDISSRETLLNTEGDGIIVGKDIEVKGSGNITTNGEGSIITNDGDISTAGNIHAKEIHIKGAGATITTSSITGFIDTAKSGTIHAESVRATTKMTIGGIDVATHSWVRKALTGQIAGLFTDSEKDAIVGNLINAAKDQPNYNDFRDVILELTLPLVDFNVHNTVTGEVIGGNIADVSPCANATDVFTEIDRNAFEGYTVKCATDPQELMPVEPPEGWDTRCEQGEHDSGQTDSNDGGSICHKLCIGDTCTEEDPTLWQDVDFEHNYTVTWLPKGDRFYDGVSSYYYPSQPAETTYPTQGTVKPYTKSQLDAVEGHSISGDKIYITWHVNQGETDSEGDTTYPALVPQRYAMNFACPNKVFVTDQNKYVGASSVNPLSIGDTWATRTTKSGTWASNAEYLMRGWSTSGNTTTIYCGGFPVLEE